jgi:threonine dehydrogenase-like Zn-dependent dehydrogenase
MELKEIFGSEPRKLGYRTYEDGPMPASKVRVKVEHAAPKHGTEFTHFRGVDPFMENRYDEEWQCFLPDDDAKARPFSFRPGNMWVGTVQEIGTDVKADLHVGQRVTGYGPLKPTHTTEPGNCRPMPEGMTWKQAMCYDPAQFALGGIRDGHVRLGDNVAVFGLGAIGLIAAQMAKLSGAAMVIVLDPIEKRRKAALENGADVALDPTACDAGLEIRRLTEKRGADVILETSGSYPALQAAIRGCAYEGNIAVVGWYKECHGVLDLGREAHFNQPNILISRACSEPNRDHPRWNFDRLCRASWNMLSKGLLKCENIVDPVVPFDEAAEMYMRIEQNPSESVKMGVDF